MTNTVLDGCFIGACTTAEEDLVLGALVLEQGLKNGMRPVQKGKRKVVPGSRPILDMLQKTGLAAVYEEAGFEIGLPGCSYCVGMSADKAGEGEVWLSSQNRNFENRMGAGKYFMSHHIHYQVLTSELLGSIGNLASAATVAASSFSMSITDPQPLIDMIDSERWDAIKGRGSLKPRASSEPLYVDPPECAAKGLGTGDEKSVNAESSSLEHANQATGPTPGVPELTGDLIKGKIQRLGDFVDTDAVSSSTFVRPRVRVPRRGADKMKQLAPAQYLVSARTEQELGSHCLEFTHPSFRAKVGEGFNIVVAGTGFGCGSSREQAVSALLGRLPDLLLAARLHTF